MLALFFAAASAARSPGSASIATASSSARNGAALGLLLAWAVPDLRALRAKRFYDGDLLATAAIAGALLAMPLARAGGQLAGRAGRAARSGSLLGAGVDRLRAA